MVCTVQGRRLLVETLVGRINAPAYSRHCFPLFDVPLWEKGVVQTLFYQRQDIMCNYTPEVTINKEVLTFPFISCSTGKLHCILLQLSLGLILTNVRKGYVTSEKGEDVTVL